MKKDFRAPFTVRQFILALNICVSRKVKYKKKFNSIKCCNKNGVLMLQSVGHGLCCRVTVTASYRISMGVLLDKFNYVGSF